MTLPRTVLGLVLLALTSLTLVGAVQFERFEDASKFVLKLRDGNFSDFIEDTNMPTFVSFIDPQCPHCQSLVPEWASAAKVLHNIVPLATVNCIEENLLCDDHNIERLPTLRMFAEHGKAQFDFPHERTSEAIVKFAVGALGPNMKAQMLTSPNHVRGFINHQPSKVHYLIVTSKPITAFYQALSIRYYKFAQFAYVNTLHSPEIVESLGLTGAPVPTLYRLDKDKWVAVPGALEDRFALEDEVVKTASKVKLDVYGHEIGKPAIKFDL